MTRKHILLLSAMLSVFGTEAQQKAEKTQSTLHWWGNTDEFLRQQSERSFRQIDQILESHQPKLQESPVRKMALLSLDNLLHDPRVDQHPALGEFFSKRIKNIAEKIRTDQVKDGAIIYKLYNHGFVVRTRSATIAFDLISNQSSRLPGLRIPDDVVKDIVNSCDVLFVSHFHGDHADPVVAKLFGEAGKPVFTAPDLWTDMGQNIQHPSRAVDQPETVKLANGAKIKVRALPGHQGDDILNNVYAVTMPEGITFAHTGDQSNQADLNWIDTLSASVKVDVLLVNCWTNELVRTIKGFNPRLVVTGHENEMGHSIDHREPYWLTYERLKGNTFPSVLMSWGERYHFRR